MTDACEALCPAHAAVKAGHPLRPAARPVSVPAVSGLCERAIDGPSGTESIPIEQADAADLRRKLASLPTIEQAKGMLMGLFGCDADAAYRLLRRWSHHHNVKLRVLCADLVAAAGRPHPEPFGALRAFLRAGRLN